MLQPEASQKKYFGLDEFTKTNLMFFVNLLKKHALIKSHIMGVYN